MKDNSVADFLKNLGDKSPTPGGGAVAALNGAIAAAQLKMVCEYTKDEAINQKASSLTEVCESFYKLMEADAEAFASVSQAYKTGDQEQINASLVNALSPSVAIITQCSDLISFCEQNYSTFNPSLKADVIVVLANLQAAIKSAEAMVATNLKALGSSAPASAKTNIEISSQLLQRIDELQDKVEVSE